MWNHPSSEKPQPWPSGFPQYPGETDGPDTHSSPTSPTEASDPSSRATRIFIPGAALPTWAQCLAMSFGGVSVPPPAVSVMPHEFAKGTPRAVKTSHRSLGQQAPPTIAVFRLERSREPKSGCRAMASYIVGTPKVRVTR